MVTVDQALCSGCGVCVELCPEVFAWGSDGKVTAIRQAGEEINIEEIADQCPVEAIDV